MWVWSVAELSGGSVALRLEDHDRGRCRPEYSEEILADLRWLGLVPDSGLREDGSADLLIVQSFHPERYEAALSDYRKKGGLVYGCECSRTQVRSRTGQASEEIRYDGHCRLLGLAGPSLRLGFPDETVETADLADGKILSNPYRDTGDVLVRDNRGNWTYQWCVVIDDALQGIDLIVRGQDLKASSARQAMLRRLLFGLPAIPTFHHPLLLGENGVKLSKSLSSAGVRETRLAGKGPEVCFREVCEALGVPFDPGRFEREKRKLWLESMAGTVQSRGRC